MRLYASLVALLLASFLARTAGAKDTVLVELFTSQGCSSCPPADQLLSELGHEQGSVEVIPLSFHVDYWDYIGWKDPFSSSKWSERQRSYAAAMPSDRTYTPQLVVQGEIDCVGSNESCIRRALQLVQSRPSAATIEIDSVREVAGSVLIDASAKVESGRRGVIATVAVFETGLSTGVRRGENRGRQLRNDYVVRALEEVGTIRPGDTATKRITARVPIEKSWKTENLGAVVFLQDPSSKKVLGAERAALGHESSNLKPLPPSERVPESEVALGGHCPVALVEGGQLLKGSPSLQYRYQGVVYQVMSPAAGAKFASQPAKYVPPFSTFDPVIFTETKERTTGSLNVFTLHKGKPWFFLNTDKKNRFLLRPDPYIQSALARQ